MTEFEDKGGTNTIITTNEAKPKKCLSPYMIFVWETWPKVVAENKKLKGLDIMKEVGKRWKALS